MKMPEIMTVDSDVPCFVCAGKTSIVLEVKMGDMVANEDGSLTIPVTVDRATMSCNNCDWEKLIKAGS